MLTPGEPSKGRALVLTCMGAVLLSSLAFTAVWIADAGLAPLAERVPKLLLLAIACWALYAGYAPVRWLWVITNLALAVIWVTSPFTEGGANQSWGVALPFAVGHGFVGLTLALSPAVRDFLGEQRRRAKSLEGGLDPLYTALLAFFGCLYLWALGGTRDLLGWEPDARWFTALMVGSLGSFGFLYLGVVAVRLARAPLARPLTTASSFLLAVQFPLGTALFLYWLFKVRERERTGSPPEPASDETDEVAAPS